MTHAAGIHAATPGFRADMVDYLPEPARRWLMHAIEPGTPLWTVAELTMRGEIKLGRWRKFRARQILAPGRGFMWAGAATVAGLPVRGFDRYWDGAGRMSWRLLGLLPVQYGDGPDITRSAAGRLAVESTCWMPTALGMASWARGPDPDSAVATWNVDGFETAVTVRTAADGALTSLGLERWGNPDGLPFAAYPFGADVERERRVMGVSIPTAVRAGWWWGKGRQSDGEFFRAEVTDVSFR